MGYTTNFATVTSTTGADLAQVFNEAGFLGTVPCAVMGTNTLVMTPAVPAPDIVLQPLLRVCGLVQITNTGAVTANAANLGPFPVYKDSPTGPVLLTGNEMIANNYFTLAFDPSVNGGNGGWHLQTPTISSAGTVTSITTGAGLTGGPITTTGPIALAAIADKRFLANISGGALAPAANTLTAILDNIIGSTQGMLLARGASVWQAAGETSWTPALAFGGSSTAITYATQVGQYYAVGNIILAMFNIVLTSKGAQTGTATLSIPVTAGGTNRIGNAIVTNYNNLGSVASQPFGSIAASGTTATLYKAGTGTNAALADTDFANNTALQGWMIYLSG